MSDTTDPTAPRAPADPTGRTAVTETTAPWVSVDGLNIALDGSILRLCLDRPEKRNAIDDLMMTALIDAIDEAGRDEAVRAIVLSGAGDHFCAGADIIARNATASGAGRRPRVGSIQRRVPSLAHRLIPLMRSVQTPIVCGVQGFAAGIGFQLALAADFTIATSDATFWEPFCERGFTPDSGATWLLPRLIGAVRARELLLLGRRLAGDEAVEWGLVHSSTSNDELAEAVDALAHRLAAGPTVALGLTKWLVNTSADTSIEDQLRNEAFALELSSRSDDFRTGMAAFREKRPPEFEGR